MPLFRAKTTHQQFHYSKPGVPLFKIQMHRGNSTIQSQNYFKKEMTERRPSASLRPFMVGSTSFFLPLTLNETRPKTSKRAKILIIWGKVQSISLARDEAYHSVLASFKATIANAGFPLKKNSLFPNSTMARINGERALKES